MKYDEQSVSDRRRTDPPHPPKPPGKKDRARWCGGKAGREHDYVVVVPPNAFGLDRECHWSRYRLNGRDWWVCRHRWVCSKCGRHDFRSVTREECVESMTA